VVVPDDASVPELASVSLLAAELSLVLEAALVDVVEVVEFVCADDASALVFVGGVISGVLFGTASETVVLPHAPNARAHSTAAHAAHRPRRGSATRGLTAVPYACRTWGSR
jgi:hypothetical protein